MLLALVLLLNLTVIASASVPNSRDQCKQALGNQPEITWAALNLDQRAIAGIKEVYMQRAAVLDATFNYNGVVDAYDSLLQLDPLDPQAHRNRGAALVRMGDFDSAITAFECTLNLDVKMKFTGSILEWAQHMLTLRPGYEHKLSPLWNRGRDLAIFVHHDRGNALYRNGDYNGAIAAYDMALDPNPQFQEPHYNLGQALYYTGIQEAHYNLGKALYYTGKYDDAISTFDRILQLDPLDPQAHTLRARALLVKGDYSGAITGFDRTLELAPQNKEAHFDRGEAQQLKELRSKLRCVLFRDSDHELESIPHSFELWSSCSWTFAAVCILAILLRAYAQGQPVVQSKCSQPMRLKQQAFARAASEARAAKREVAERVNQDQQAKNDLANKGEAAEQEMLTVGPTTKEATPNSVAKRILAMKHKAAEPVMQKTAAKWSRHRKAHELAEKAIEADVQKAPMAVRPSTGKTPASVVRNMMQKALATQQVERSNCETDSDKLGPDPGTKQASVEMAKHAEGKLKDSPQQIVENRTEPPDGSVCPMTYNAMMDPVVCSDGHTYERSSIEEWLKEHNTSPVTGAILEFKHLVPNRALRKVIQEWEQETLSTTKLVVSTTHCQLQETLAGSESTKSTSGQTGSVALAAATLGLRHRQQRRVSTSAAGA